MKQAKESWYKQFDPVVLVIGIPIMTMIVFLSHRYLVIPLSVNYRLGQTGAYIADAVIAIFFFGGWTYLSRTKVIIEEIDLEEDAERRISFEQKGPEITQILSESEARGRIEGLFQYIKERIADEDWDDAWAYYEELDGFVTNAHISNKKEYYEKLYQLKERIEQGQAKEESKL